MQDSACIHNLTVHWTFKSIPLLDWNWLAQMDSEREGEVDFNVYFLTQLHSSYTRPEVTNLFEPESYFKVTESYDGLPVCYIHSLKMFLIMFYY